MTDYYGCRLSWAAIVKTSLIVIFRSTRVVLLESFLCQIDEMIKKRGVFFPKKGRRGVFVKKKKKISRARGVSQDRGEYTYPHPAQHTWHINEPIPPSVAQSSDCMT